MFAYLLCSAPGTTGFADFHTYPVMFNLFIDFHTERSGYLPPICAIASAIVRNDSLVMGNANEYP